MQPLLPHGASKRLLSLLGGDTTLDLVRYTDGTFGIVQDGQAIGCWAASEEVQCIKVFHQLGELHESGRCLIMTRATFRAATAAAIAARANLN
jgi:hypothetical protein